MHPAISQQLKLLLHVGLLLTVYFGVRLRTYHHGNELVPFFDGLGLA
jgi:hypothetical protein